MYTAGLPLPKYSDIFCHMLFLKKLCPDYEMTSSVFQKQVKGDLKKLRKNACGSVSKFSKILPRRLEK